VGGGYEDHELSDIALAWMIGKTKNFIEYDLDYIREHVMTDNRQWTKGIKNDTLSYAEQANLYS
jgi:hypothetical protein